MNCTNAFGRLSPRVSQLPHHLSDNLRWKCSNCTALVPARETHVHLVSCIVAVEAELYDSITVEDFDSNKDRLPEDRLKTMSLKGRNKVAERPRTKRLDRPTPNIVVPVVVDAEDNNRDPVSENGIMAITCGTKPITAKLSRYTFSNSKYRGRPRVVSSRNQNNRTASIRSNNNGGDGGDADIPGPCKACERSEAPEKFHSHTATPRKIGSAPKATTEEDGKEPSANGKQLKRCQSEVKCYVCSQKIPMDTMSKHEVDCLEAWKEENNRLPSSERKPLPQKKSELLIIKSGCDPCGWEHFKSKLAPCSKCGRTFYPHRLPNHERLCNGLQDSGSSSNASISTQATSSCSTNKSGEGQEQVTNNNGSKVKKRMATVKKANNLRKLDSVPCIKCGRKFSSSSVNLHELRCNSQKMLMKIANDKDSETPNSDSPETAAIVDDTEWQHHLETLAACRKCGRTFFPERLLIHQPHCKANPVAENSTNS